MQNKQLFRKVAFERLSSPEQLDQAVKVTSPIGWLALVATGIIILVAILWSIFGKISTKVSGTGILVKSGGVFGVYPSNTGMLSMIKKKVGDIVEADECVALIYQPEIKNELREAQVKLNQFENLHALNMKFCANELKLKEDSSEQQVRNQENMIIYKEKQLGWIKEKVEAERKLYNEGITAIEQLNETLIQYDSVLMEIAKAQNTIKEISVDLLQTKNSNEQKLLDSQHEIDRQEIHIQTLQEKLDLYSSVISPDSGLVVEQLSNVGEVLDPQFPLMNLEHIEDRIRALEAIIFVAAYDGKKVLPGMEVNVSPTTVKNEEHGSIVGKVTSIYEYPASQEGMMRILHNSNTVSLLTAHGTSIELHADLMPDANTISGFKWTSKKGPPIMIKSGTICNVTIITREQRPIGMAIPLFKKYVMGQGSPVPATNIQNSK